MYRDDRGELKRPYVLDPPTKQVNIRLAATDLEMAKRLAKRKEIPKYQSYIKTLLHEALVKEVAKDKAPSLNMGEPIPCALIILCLRFPRFVTCVIARPAPPASPPFLTIENPPSSCPDSIVPW